MPGKSAIWFVSALVACGACSSSYNGPSATPDAGGAAGTGAPGADAGADVAAPPRLAASVITTVTLPGTPVAVAYNAGTKKAYFACLTPAKQAAGVAVVDGATNAVLTTV